MEPMFLPDVEVKPKPGPYRDLIRTMQEAGSEYPQIWHLFAFTQEIMRGESPLSPGLRELIAAWTSSENQCPF